MYPKTNDTKRGFIPESVAEICISLVGEISLCFPGSRILLFGSYAKGNYNKDSDLDIAVFLTLSFKNRDPIELFRQICRLCGRYDFDIQPQVFFEDEFLCPSGIVEEIVEYGIDIDRLIP